MHYVWLASLLILLLSSAGCSQEEKKENGAIGKAKVAKVVSPTADGAKAHVQKYIDRILGGDESVRVGLLGLAAVDFGSFDSIVIISSNTMYSKSGKKLNRMFSVRMRVTGKDSRTGKTIAKNIECGVINTGSGYKVLGASF